MALCITGFLVLLKLHEGLVPKGGWRTNGRNLGTHFPLDMKGTYGEVVV